MKTLLKLLVAAAIINACARGAMAAWSYYQLKDGAQQTILFGADATSAQLRDEIVRRAAELELPVEPAQVEVTREGVRTVAQAAYTQRIELFPGYERPFDFSFTVDALSVRPVTADDVKPESR